ncbi:hypothetical protein [Pseudomonas sp. OA65]|uniref:hypothetical protein n=1 Tax=Pseudomonas sp. OA65 TaxID=2818431 RepID=UPI001A9DC28E|nr:hypothetical protein [Pseudomonas sp. OA65]MBO1538399.1 hypothetical protein [Pseudomonas sp. OA65]
MKNLINSWDEVPLLRASANVLDTPIKTLDGSPCGAPFTPRLNVGNIHEIKQFWNLSIQD